MRPKDESVLEGARVFAPRRDSIHGRRASNRLLIVLLLVLAGMVAGLIAAYGYWWSMQEDLRALTQAVVRANAEQAALERRVASAAEEVERQKLRLQVEERSPALAAGASDLREPVLPAQAADPEVPGETAPSPIRERGAAVDPDAARERPTEVVRRQLLGEAERLLRRAALRLRAERDATGAVSDLREAVRLLGRGGDDAWSELRGSLANDIAALASFSGVEEARLSERFEDLIASVQELPSNASGPLASRKREVGVRNLRLQLERAQLAYRQRSPSGYRASLSAAETWFRQSFDPNGVASERFIAYLRSLQRAYPGTPLPDLSRSVAILERSRTQYRHGVMR